MRTKKQNVQSKKQPQLTALTTKQARRLIKPRQGFDGFAEPLAGIVEKYGPEIGTAGVDIDVLRESVAQYQALTDQRNQLAEQLALVDDTRLQLGSKAWTQELAIYGHARVAARLNPAIAAALEKFELFMKNKRRSKPVVLTTPPSNGGAGTTQPPTST